MPYGTETSGDRGREVEAPQTRGDEKKEKVGAAVVMRCTKVIDGQLWQFDLALGDMDVVSQG